MTRSLSETFCTAPRLLFKLPVTANQGTTAIGPDAASLLAVLLTVKLSLPMGVTTVSAAKIRMHNRSADHQLGNVGRGH